MSYAAIRERNQAPKEEVQHSTSCHASGCPCRGTISIEGGKFFCANHAFVPSHRWPAVTEALRQNSWLIEFMDEIKTMEGELKDWRSFAEQFWASQEDEPVCVPHSLEAFPMYETRMRKELLHRCGLAKQPSARIPTGRGKPGNMGAFLGVKV